MLRLDVGATSALTALLALGALAAFGLAAKALSNGADPYRLAGLGAVAGLPAFAAVSLAAPLDSALLFRAGTVLIGFGGGLFSVGTLSAAMAIEPESRNGLALGAWGAVQATCAGLAVAAGGALRDGAAALASAGLLGPALTGPAVGYGIVYHVEIALLFGTLVAIGPLAGYRRRDRSARSDRFGLAELPG